MKKERITSDEADKRYQEACKLISQGSQIKAACDKVGIHTTTYRYHLNKIDKKPTRKYVKKPRVLVTEITTPVFMGNKCFMFTGSPHDLAALARAFQ